MVTYIPGPESLLMPAAQNIAQGLSQLINPNLEAQRALQMSIARNPAMLQQLADAEFAAPGTMARLGFGKLGQAAAALPATAQTEFLVRNRQQVVKGLEVAQNVDILKNTLSAQNIDRVTKYMADNPGVAFEAAMKATMGVTPSEVVVKQVEAEKAEATHEELQKPGVREVAGAMGATGLTPSVLSAEANKIRAQERFAEMTKNGVAITIEDFRNGKYNADDLNAIFSTPAGKGLELQVDMYNNEQRIKAANGDNDAMERLKLGKAFDLFTKIRGGSLEAVTAWLYDPTAQARAEELAANPQLATTKMDRDLLAVQQQINQWDDEQRRSQLSLLGKDLMSHRSAFQQTLLPTDRGGMRGSKGDAQRAMIVGQMNETLRQRARFGAPLYQVEYTDVPVWGGLWSNKQFVYRDAEGNVVPEGLVDAPITVRRGPPTTPPGSNQPPAGGAGGAGAGASKTPSGGTAPAPGTTPQGAAAGAAAPATTPVTPAAAGTAPSPAAAATAAGVAPSPLSVASPNTGPASIPPLMAPPPATIAGGIGPQGVGPVAQGRDTVTRGQTSPVDAAVAGLRRVTGLGPQAVAQTVPTAGLQPPGVNAVTSTGQPVFVRQAMVRLKKQTLAEMRAQFARWKAEMPPEDYAKMRDAADIEYPNSKTIKR